jgi:hypothetical protein
LIISGIRNAWDLVIFFAEQIEGPNQSN